MRLGREMQQPDAPVLGMQPPFDEARLLQLVEDARQCDRLDFEDFSETALLDAFVARQMRQHLTLRTRQPEPVRRRVLLEALAHQAGHVVQQESDVSLRQFHPILLSALNISLLMTVTSDQRLKGGLTSKPLPDRNYLRMRAAAFCRSQARQKIT